MGAVPAHLSSQFTAVEDEVLAILRLLQEQSSITHEQRDSVKGAIGVLTDLHSTLPAWQSALHCLRSTLMPYEYPNKVSFDAVLNSLSLRVEELG